MKIGAVAAEAGVKIDTLRYYERRGLLATPHRLPSGYREYDAQTVPLVRFIRRAQDLGFTLKEVGELISLRRGGAKGRRADVRAVAAAKLDDIDQKLGRLQAIRNALSELLHSCECAGGTPSCPILEALNDEPPEANGLLLRAKGGMKSVQIPIQGMSCARCVRRIEAALSEIEGASEVKVSFAQRTARVRFDPAKASAGVLIAAINELGYRAGRAEDVPTNPKADLA